MRASGDLKAPFFDEAMEILASDGYGGLKLAPLCKRLGLTTGAFYHSFKNWNDFTTQLLDRWMRERTQSFIDLVHAEDDALSQVDVLLQAALSLPHAAEAAIRVWSAIDPTVCAMQEEVDTMRYRVVREAFAAMLPDESADRFAKSGMYLLIGAEQAQAFRDPAAFEWALQQFRAAAVREAEAHR